MRHSLATSMLRSGATLGEIGEVLRHRLVKTTEIYAKVDFSALRVSGVLKGSQFGRFRGRQCGRSLAFGHTRTMAGV